MTKQINDPRIGILCREGKTVYYAILGSHGTAMSDDNYVESYDLQEIEDQLEEFDNKSKQGLIYPTFTQLQERVSRARSKAEKEAREVVGRGGFLRSRGAWYLTSGDQGPNGPRNENYYKGSPITAKELKALIADVEANYPEVKEISVEGGFDYAETMEDWTSGNYDAYVSDWSVLVWKRGF